MNTLKWQKLSRCIEFYVAGGPHGRRQVASLIPVDAVVEPRHEALAALICHEPRMLLNWETIALLAQQFGLHPILVIKQADGWRSDLWCGIEEVVGNAECGMRNAE